MSCCGFSLRGKQFRPSRRKIGRAFTLIEVLVVVAIIALLVAILLPSLSKVRKQARRTVCLSNMHQMAIGLYTYQADYKGKPPHWKDYLEQITDGVALWVIGDRNVGHPTRLGMLYPKYVGKNEDIFYCPDATRNGLLNKGENGRPALYPWKYFGTSLGWAYGSYEYRPRHYFPPSGGVIWVGVDYDEAPRNTSIAADGFSGSWDSFGPYPSNTPIQDEPRTLYYNLAYVDGSAKPVRGFVGKSNVSPFGPEFGTRAAGPAQQKPEYTS